METKNNTAGIDLDKLREAFDAEGPNYRICVDRFKQRPDEYKFEQAKQLWQFVQAVARRSTSGSELAGASAIKTWQERAQEIGFAGCYPDTDELEELKSAEISDLRAALAKQAGAPAVSDVGPITEKEAANLIAKRGMRKTGYVMEDDNDVRCIVNKGAVWWLGKELDALAAPAPAAQSEQDAKDAVRPVLDAECVQGKCGMTTVGCWGECWRKAHDRGSQHTVTATFGPACNAVAISAGGQNMPAWPTGLHPATADLVHRFAGALAEKLYRAEQKYGYSNGWMAPHWMDECRAQLRRHIQKGDPRDVAAYCAFLWHHGQSTATVRADLGAMMDVRDDRMKDQLDQIGRAIGYGRAIQLLGQLWDDMMQTSYPQVGRHQEGMHRRADIERIEAGMPIARVVVYYQKRGRKGQITTLCYPDTELQNVARIVSDTPLYGRVPYVDDSSSTKVGGDL